jgi:uncharacterized protein YueI
MEKDSRDAAAGSWNTELEKAITVGIYGTPELKPDEKVLYLGEFKERVLVALTKQQVAESALYIEVIEALQDERAARMIVHGDITSGADKYYQMARKFGKPYLIRHDQKYKKSTMGLLVVGNEAVDVETIAVEDRATRLAAIGLPQSLIQAAGQKICSDCYALMEKLAPEERINYKRLNFIDRLTGDQCPAH